MDKKDIIDVIIVEIKEQLLCLQANVKLWLFNFKHL